MAANPYLNYINANSVHLTTEEAIAQRARELWEQRGGTEGHELEDCVQAETEVIKAMAEKEASNAVAEPEIDGPRAATATGLVTSAAEAESETHGTKAETKASAMAVEPESPWAMLDAVVINAMVEALTPKPAFIAVKVGDTTYMAEYDAASCDYKPGDFKRGEPIWVQLEEDKMRIQCSNGQQLEATVVRKARAATV